MIIFIGGLPGVGKSTLAKIISEHFGILSYEIDALKKKMFLSDPNYEYNLKNGIPFSDEIRIKVFKKVLSDLKKLSKKHKHIVVEDTMHKKLFQEMLFSGSKKFYKKSLLIWIKADENLIKKRFKENPRKGHIIIKNHFKMYLSFKREFDKFDNADIIFENNSDINTSKKMIISLLKENGYIN